MARADEPAFPRAGCDWTEDQGDGAWAQPGMTMREWYAGQAIKSIIQTLGVPMPNQSADVERYTKEQSRLAFQYADAMLAESEKK